MSYATAGESVARMSVTTGPWVRVSNAAVIAIATAISYATVIAAVVPTASVVAATSVVAASVIPVVPRPGADEDAT